MRPVVMDPRRTHPIRPSIGRRGLPRSVGVSGFSGVALAGEDG